MRTFAHFLESRRAMTDTTHAPVCWSWGPRHYECAVGQIKRDEALLKQALEALESSDWYIGQLERQIERDEAPMKQEVSFVPV